MTVCIGRNDIDASTAAEVVARVRGIIEWNQRDPSDHIVLSIPKADGDTSTRLAKIDEPNASLAAALPRHWSDWAAYLRSETTLTQAGVTPTAQDQADIAAGLTPTSFRGDNLHFNALAYDAINTAVLRIFAAKSIVDWTEATDEEPEPELQIHPYGLTDASHRCVASRVGETQAVGSPVTAWSDEIGTLDLANAGSTLVLEQGPGGKAAAVATPNAAVASNTQRVFSTTVATDTRTIAVVYNNCTPAAVQRVHVDAKVFSLSRAASGQITASAAGLGVVTAPGGNVARWRAAFAWYDAATSSLCVDIDGTPVTLAGALPTPSSPTFVIGGGEAVALDVTTEEVITWTRALTSAERATVRAALKQTCPEIV